jgi:hypothetical protein
MVRLVRKTAVASISKAWQYGTIFVIITIMNGLSLTWNTSIID